MATKHYTLDHHLILVIHAKFFNLLSFLYKHFHQYNNAHKHSEKLYKFFSKEIELYLLFLQVKKEMILIQYNVHQIILNFRD